MRTLYIILFLFIYSISFAQFGGNRTITGKVTDKDSGEPLAFTNVALMRHGILLTGMQTDFDGNYIFSELDSGIYDINVSYTGYMEVKVEKIPTIDDSTIVNIKMNHGVEMECVKIIEFKKPLVETCCASSGSVRVRGSRSKKTTYYMDGIRVSSMPTRSISNLAYLIPGTSSNSTKENNRYKSGQLTATEVNDFADWDFWSSVNESNFIQHSVAWKMNPSHRISVQVKNKEDFPVQDAIVSLLDKDEKVIWTTKSDNLGMAELFSQYFDDVSEKEAKYIEIKKGEKTLIKTPIGEEKRATRTLTVDAPCENKELIELAFLLDISGSMGDELLYLKEEIKSIVEGIKKIKSDYKIRVGMVFYKGHSNPNTIQYFDLEEDINIVFKKINAVVLGGGPDEAMDLALATAVDSFSWSEKSHKISFIIGDELFFNVEENRKRLRDKTKSCAEKGIKIVPIGCSDMNKELEYVMRSMAIATGGTYLALTDDSGIGNAHIKPTAKKMDIMLLSHLLQDVILRFTTDHSCLAETKEEDVVWSPSYKLNASKGYESKALKLKLFPNPVSDVIHIEGVSKKAEALFLCDLSGRILQKLDEEAKQHNVHHLASGTYFILIKTKKKGFVSERFLKTSGQGLSAN